MMIGKAKPGVKQKTDRAICAVVIFNIFLCQITLTCLILQTISRKKWSNI